MLSAIMFNKSSVLLFNLNRKNDVGKTKAEVAAAFINNRVEGCNVKAYCNRIEDFDESFYRGKRRFVTILPHSC